MNKFYILAVFLMITNNYAYCCGHYFKYKEFYHSEYEFLMDKVRNLPDKDRVLVTNILKARAEYVDIPGSSLPSTSAESDESFLKQLLNSVFYSPANN